MSGPFPELDGKDLPQLLEIWSSPAVDGDEYAAAWFEELGVAIADQGPEGVAALWARTHGADDDRIRGIILGLTTQVPATDALADWLKEVVHERSAQTRAAAIDGLSRIDDGKHLSLVKQFFDDASEFVRAAVLRYVRRHDDPRQALEILLGAANDAHYIVRENVADELGELGESAARPALERLRNDEHPDVRLAAETALAILGA